MEVKANLKHLRIAPRKTRLVAGLIRGLDVNKAINQLKFANKKSAEPILKLLNSAVSNAVNNYDLDKNNLTIKEIRVEDGKTLKRWMPRAHGRATVIRKRMSHIYITLSEIVDGGKREAKKIKTDDPVKLDDLAQKPKPKGRAKEDKIENKKGGEGASSKGFGAKVFQRKAG